MVEMAYTVPLRFMKLWQFIRRLLLKYHPQITDLNVNKTFIIKQNYLGNKMEFRPLPQD